MPLARQSERPTQGRKNMKPIAIGSRRELLLDDHLLERFGGTAALTLHRPVRREIVFPLQSDPVVLEKGNGLRAGHAYMTVFQDGGVYRMYYGVTRHHFEPEKSVRLTHYAESRDGIHWETPSLGLFEFEGSRDNNVVWMEDESGRTGDEGFASFRDENPACDPRFRYKALAKPGRLGSKRLGGRGLVALGSPDGIHWEMMAPGHVITDGAFDSQNLAFWDAVRGEYRAYWRDFYTGPNGKHWRGTKTAVSSDFRHWTQGEWLQYPAAVPDQLYTNQVVPYFRAPHLFVGFPSRYVERTWTDAVADLPEPERRRSIIERTGSERIGAAVTDTLFMSSRDGVEFRLWGEAFVPPGLRPIDNWIYGDNYANWGIVTTKSDVEGAPDELSIYLSEGSRRDHYSKVYRRYTLRMDGFVSVRAGRYGGEVVTKPLTFTGHELEINFAASAAGEVRVEIQDAHGVPVPGFALDDSVEALGDDLERRIRWRSGTDLAPLAGTPVKVRFHLVDADLYAFHFV